MESSTQGREGLGSDAEREGRRPVASTGGARTDLARRAFEQQLRAIDQAVERGWKGDAPSDEGAPAEPAAGKHPGPRVRSVAVEIEPAQAAGRTKESPAASRPSLRALSLPALHRLDKLCAHLRHSVVGVCFHNLRIFVQELPRKRGSGAFLQKLRASMARVPESAGQIEAFFAHKVTRAAAVGDFFAAERAGARRGCRRRPRRHAGRTAPLRRSGARPFSARRG